MIGGVVYGTDVCVCLLLPFMLVGFDCVLIVVDFGNLGGMVDLIPCLVVIGCVVFAVCL